MSLGMIPFPTCSFPQLPPAQRLAHQEHLAHQEAQPLWKGKRPCFAIMRHLWCSAFLLWAIDRRICDCNHLYTYLHTWDAKFQIGGYSGRLLMRKHLRKLKDIHVIIKWLGCFLLLACVGAWHPQCFLLCLLEAVRCSVLCHLLLNKPYRLRVMLQAFRQEKNQVWAAALKEHFSLKAVVWSSIKMMRPQVIKQVKALLVFLFPGSRCLL